MTHLERRKGLDYTALADRETRAFIRKCEDTYKAEEKRGAESIWKMGKALVDAKSRLKHGEFTTWIEVNLQSSYQSAANFMRVYEAFKNINFIDLNIAPSALYDLARVSISQETRQVAVELAQSGETITHTDAKTLIEAGKLQITTPIVPESSTRTEPQSDDSDDETGYFPDDEELQPDESNSETEPLPPAAPATTLQERAASAAVVHDTLTARDDAAPPKPDEADLTDTEWLQTIPAYRVLETLQGKGIIARRSMLDFRTLEKALGIFQHHAVRIEAVKHPDNTPFSTALLSVGKLRHPRDWGICPPCKGGGCGRCGSAGYDMSGGIEAQRIERGEVDL